MKQYIRMLIYSIGILVHSLGFADCCTTPCVKFKDKVKAFCSLFVRDFEGQSGFIQNATFRNLRVLGNEQIDGALIANNTAVIDTDLIINGQLTVDGSIVASNGIEEYAYFVLDTTTAVANNAIIPLNANGIAPTAGITNAAGVITLVKAGTYLIKFSAVQATGSFGTSGYSLDSNPAGAQTLIPNTTYAGDSSNLVVGFAIYTATAGQQIGIRNVGGAVTLSTAGADGADPNVAASISIIKLN